MDVGTQSKQDLDPQTATLDSPTVTVCESCPGTAVLIEDGNTDGWIASDVTCEITR